MDSQENFSKINLNNKNLDLEISNSRFFNISEIILQELKLRKPNPLNLKKFRTIFQVLNYNSILSLLLFYIDPLCFHQEHHH